MHIYFLKVFHVTEVELNENEIDEGSFHDEL